MCVFFFFFFFFFLLFFFVFFVFFVVVVVFWGLFSEQEKACASHNSRTITKAVTYVCYQRPLQLHRHRRNKVPVSSDTDV